MNEDKVLEIMQPQAAITDETLVQIAEDTDLREACEDVMMIQGSLAGKPDTEAALQRFHSQHQSASTKSADQTPTLAPLSSASRRKPLLRRVKSGYALAVAAAFIGILILIHLGNIIDSAPQHQTANTPLLTQSTSLDKIVRPEGKADAVYEIPPRKVKPRSIFGFELPATSSTASEPVTVTIPLGSSLQLTLSDGTKVFMHPGARLVYPEQFVSSERCVSLTGEAYFCVAHDARRPFIVSTPRGDVRDYGTEFNVNASDLLTEVVLVEGSVGVTPSRGREQLLQPGQKMSIMDGRFVVETADTDPFLAWRDGYFYYDQQMLGDIVKQLAAFYNLRVECYNADLLSLRLRYIIPRSSSAQYAVDILNQLQKEHIFLRNGTIVIK